MLDARSSLEGCYEVLQDQLAGIDCGWEDFLWAVQVGGKQLTACACVGLCRPVTAFQAMHMPRGDD